MNWLSSDLLLVMMTLSSSPGIGPDFNSFVVAVNTASRNDPLRFSDLCGLLLAHEALLSAQTPTAALPSLSSSSAFYTRPNQQFGSNPKSNYRPPKPPFPQNPNPTSNRTSNQPKPNTQSNSSTGLPQRAPFNPHSNQRTYNKYKGPQFTCQICSGTFCKNLLLAL